MDPEETKVGFIETTPNPLDPVGSAELIHEHAAAIAAGDALYRASVWGMQVPAGTWVGWIEFHPIGERPILRTARETTQSSRSALEYWSTGLGAVYLEGALERAQALTVGRSADYAI